jgi:hypothetical protein
MRVPSPQGIGTLQAFFARPGALLSLASLSHCGQKLLLQQLKADTALLKVRGCALRFTKLNFHEH